MPSSSSEPSSPPAGSSPIAYQQHFEDGGDTNNALDEPTTFKIWGMTARILVDAARLAYAKEPNFSA